MMPTHIVAIKKRYEAYLSYNGTVKYMEYLTKSQFEVLLDRNI